MRIRGLRPIGGAMLLAVALIVLASSIGTALDYARGWLVRMRLQDALDAAAHAAAGQGLSKAERIARARCALQKERRHSGQPWRITPSVDVVDQLVRVSAGTRVTTAFISLAGIHEITVIGSAAVPILHSHRASPCKTAGRPDAKPIARGGR